MELEALEAILMDDLIEYEGNLPSGWVAAGKSYKVIIAPEDEEGGDSGDYPLKAELLFAHTPKYPEEPPSYKLRSVTGLSDADLAEATAVLEEQVNLGALQGETSMAGGKGGRTNRLQGRGHGGRQGPPCPEGARMSRPGGAGPGVMGVTASQPARLCGGMAVVARQWAAGPPSGVHAGWERAAVCVCAGGWGDEVGVVRTARWTPREACQPAPPMPHHAPIPRVYVFLCCRRLPAPPPACPRTGERQSGHGHDLHPHRGRQGVAAGWVRGAWVGGAGGVDAGC